MIYSTDHIYRIAGRENNTAFLILIPELREKFGNEIPVKFLYELEDRQDLEANYVKGIDRNLSTQLSIECVTYLSTSINGELTKEFEKFGLRNEHIEYMRVMYIPDVNPFYSTSVRKIEKLPIELKQLPKGGDYTWMYHYKRMRINEGALLTPYDMNQYYAWKLYFEPNELSQLEKKKMYAQGRLREEIEYEYLIMKQRRHEIKENETTRKSELSKKFYELRFNKTRKAIEHELKRAGTTSKDVLSTQFKDNLFTLFGKTFMFNDHQLNVMGKKPIYLDRKGLVHVYVRHVKEFQLTDYYSSQGKDYFQWNEEDIIMVMSSVIMDLDVEIQSYWIQSPGQPYLRFKNPFYFQGDYYAFKIDGMGKINTFYKCTRIGTPLNSNDDQD